MTTPGVNESSANDELLENFLIDGWEALGSYDQATLSLADCFQEDNLKDLRVVSHRIKGTAALYGYKQISRLAEMVERILTNTIPEDAQNDVAQFLEQVGVCLHSALEHLARDGREPNLGLELAHMGGTELLSSLLKRYPEAFLRPADEAETPESRRGDSLSAQAVAFKNANLDVWEYFPLEAGEHIAAMREALDNLSDPQERQGSSTSVTALFRAAHTLKGSAYMVDFSMMGNFAHELEDLMDLVREGNMPLDDAVIGLLRRGTNTLEAMMAAAEGLPNRLEQDLPELQTLLTVRLGKASPDSEDSAIEDTNNDVERHAVSRALNTFRQANEDVWEYFPLEVVENIAAMRDGLTLAKSEEDERRPDATSVTSIFRAAHTIKGSSYMVDLRLMGDFAKELEALMDLVRKGDRPLDDATSALLNQGIDVLDAMLLAAEGESDSVDTLLGPAQVAFAAALGHDLKQGQGSEHAQVASAQLSSNLRIFFQENQDVWEYFAPEAREHIDTMRNALIVAEGDVRAGNTVENDTITQLFRVAHTLKGSAYMVGFDDLGKFAHKLEELMSAVREDDIPFSSEVHDTLMSGLQVLEQMLRSAEGTGAGLEILLFDTEQQLANLLGTEAPVPTALANLPQSAVDNPEPASKPTTTATIRVSLDKLDALMNLAGDMVMARSRLLRRLGQLDTTIKLLAGSHERMLRISGDFEERYINPRFSAEGELGTDLTRAQAGQLGQAGQQGAVAVIQAEPSNAVNGQVSDGQNTPARYANDSFKTSVSGLFDELEFDTYDDLNILARTISEMTLDITEIQNQFNVIDRGLRGEVDTIQSITRDLRQQISRSRMVPIGRVFSRLTRLVNQAPLDKSYRLDFSGETVEVDNVIVETIIDPLLHLVRNSFYHGIEPMTERISSGKDAEGVVTVRAFYRGNDVFIEVQDDGRGINVEAVKRKAIEQGLGQVDAIQALSDEQAIQLIFAAGLSTAQQVSTEAGRGVGMDAVAESIRRLNGDILVSSTPGQGSRFTIRLPLTLITSEALIVQVGTNRFALPVDNVRNLQRIPAGQIFQMNTSDTISLALTQHNESGAREYFVFDNQPVRIYNLKRLFGLSQKRNEGMLNAVILDVGGERFAALVDDYMGIEEVVVRGLSEQLQGVFYLSGVTVSSSGELLLILDPSSFDKLSKYNPVAASTTLPLEEVVSKHVLLVDDSVSVRRVCGRMLERGGFEVSTAVDGQEAIERIQRGEFFDAIVTDLEMPRANGYEVIEQVRRTEGASNIPIVMMTTRAGTKHSQLAFDLGANDYLSKPVDEAQLVQTIKTLTG